MKFVDAHLHLDVLMDRVPAALDWFEAHEVLPVSWAYAYQGVQTVDDLTRYFEQQCRVMADVRKRIPIGYFVGVHPRNLPADLQPEDVGELLAPWVPQPGCVGMGEIGIDTDDPREAEVFQAQLAWSAALSPSQVVGVHTPRANKTAVTLQILELVVAHAPRPERVLVDHCTRETLPRVLEVAGFAGISLSPNKSTVDEAVDMLLAHPDAAARIMCNTDSAIALYEPLFALARDDRLGEAMREQVMRKTALTAYGLTASS